jgi:hypothetical protein
MRKCSRQFRHLIHLATTLILLIVDTVRYLGYVVGSRAGAVAVGPGSSCWPAAFAICRCFSPSRNSVSSSRLIARSMRISCTTRTYLLRIKGYGTYRTGSAFNCSCLGRETR